MGENLTDQKRNLTMLNALTREADMKKPYGDKSGYNVFDFGNEPWDIGEEK